MRLPPLPSVVHFLSLMLEVVAMSAEGGYLEGETTTELAALQILTRSLPQQETVCVSFLRR